MDVCQCEQIEEKFDADYVASKLEEYRKKGPKRTTRQLIELLMEGGVKGQSLLDIGGGLGDIQHALLGAGVAEVQSVEASKAYLDASLSEAERLGKHEKIETHHGNFVELADKIKSADIVSLDRVICCFDEMEPLVSLSAQKAKKVYGLVYPRSTWWVKVLVWIYYDLRHMLKGSSMRYFVHEPSEVEALIEAEGLRRQNLRFMGPWQVAVYGRD